MARDNNQRLAISASRTFTLRARLSLNRADNAASALAGCCACLYLRTTIISGIEQRRMAKKSACVAALCCWAMGGGWICSYAGSLSAGSAKKKRVGKITCGLYYHVLEAIFPAKNRHC